MRHHALALAVLLFAATPLLPTFARGELPPATVPANTGVNTGVTSLELDERDFTMMKDAGISYLRADFFWGEVEKERGVYNFQRYDALVAKLKEHGIRPVIILDYGNNLYEPEGGGIKTEEGRQGFAKYAAQTVKRYNKVMPGIIFEIWNEPNSNDFWKPERNPEQFAALVIAASQAMREADPSTVIVSGGVLELNWDVTQKYIDATLKADMHKHIDAFGVHFYGGKTHNNDVERIGGEITWLREMFVKYGGSRELPIMNTEFGGQFDKEFQGDEATKLLDHAAMYVRMYLNCLLNDVRLNIWYEWQWEGGHSAHALLNPDGSPRPAYEAVKVFNTAFAGCAFTRRIDLGDPELYAAEFSSADKKLLAVWTTGKKQSVKIPISGTRKTLPTLDLLGKPGKVAVMDGAITLEAGNRPVYIEL